MMIENPYLSITLSDLLSNINQINIPEWKSNTLRTLATIYFDDTIILDFLYNLADIIGIDPYDIAPDRDHD